jgi:tetratricopeptide (TPR) repeat protein
MRILFIICIFIPLSAFVNSQQREDSRELFDEGDYFFSRGEFEEAAYYFRKLTESDSKNCHFNFRLGECYMNIPGKEQLAIPCFEKASKNTVEKKKYRMKDFDELNAPLHTWFYLGNVYRMAGRLDEALTAYNTFINSPFYYGNYNINVVENEIKSCERAKIIMDSPVDVAIEPMDSVINSSASELNPVISSDETQMVFIRKLKFYDAILWVTREGNTWTQPVNLNPLVGSDGEFYPVFLSKDGKELYMVRKGPENKDLYVSYRTDATWTKAVSLGSAINSAADETSASLSFDGKTLWFASNRKGGQGGADIYYAVRNKNNQWGKPKNAGKIINTAFDEDCPYPADNDLLLFFCSKGHYSMGGFDIFYTSKSDKNWKSPVNIGYPVNNTTDNSGFVPVFKGTAGYYSQFDNKDGSGSEDIYKVTLRSNFPLP